MVQDAPEYQPPQHPLHPSLDKKTQEYINTYMNMTGGDAQKATIAAKVDRGRFPNDVALRNAEHALFAQHVVNFFGSPVGKAALGVGVPAWTAYKQVFAGKGSDPEPVSEMKWGYSPMSGNINKGFADESQ